MDYCAIFAITVFFFQSNFASELSLACKSNLLLINQKRYTYLGDFVLNCVSLDYSRDILILYWNDFSLSDFFTFVIITFTSFSYRQYVFLGMII